MLSATALQTSEVNYKQSPFITHRGSAARYKTRGCRTTPYDRWTRNPPQLNHGKPCLDLPEHLRGMMKILTACPPKGRRLRLSSPPGLSTGNGYYSITYAALVPGTRLNNGTIALHSVQPERRKGNTFSALHSFRSLHSVRMAWRTDHHHYHHYYHHQRPNYYRPGRT